MKLSIQFLSLCFFFGTVYSEDACRSTPRILLEPGSQDFEQHFTYPPPTFVKFYLFNVANKDQVNFLQVQPILQEKGPYVYRQEKVREILGWDRKFGTVRYQEKIYYFFEPEMSNGSQSDEINHVNSVSINLLGELESLWEMLQTLGHSPDHLMRGIRGELVETHTAAELLFDGFSVQRYWPQLIESMCLAVNNCKFGLYYFQNNSMSAEIEIGTGSRCQNDVFEVMRYDKKTELTYWYGESCNAINGTTGIQFRPNVHRQSELYVFIPEVCRSLKLVFEKEVSVGMKTALRFQIADTVFSDTNNMCFCNENITNPCPSKSGFLNLKTCKEGKNLVASAPHFYMAGQEAIARFHGLTPEKERHETFFDIDPESGRVFRSATRGQISQQIDYDERLLMTGIGLSNSSLPYYFPICWYEEVYEVEERS